MKRFTYLATVLLVLAGVVSCKKNSDVQDPGLQPTGKMRNVTVSAGQGTAKTSVSGGALTWSANDALYVIPQEASSEFQPAKLKIVSGVGEASGTFEGKVDESITDETNLYSYCGGAWTYNDGTFSVNMPATQTYKENGLAENAFPSIGSGTISKGISLSNVFGVLRLNIKGTATLKNVKVTSASKALAGLFTVNPSTLAVTGGSSSEIILTCTGVTLSSTGSNFFVVMPAADYPANDLTVTVTKSNDETVVYILDATSVSANNVTKKQDVDDPCVGTKPVASDPVTDQCGNAYNTVKIGEQIWMAANLKCTTYSSTTEEFKGETITKYTPIGDPKYNLPYESRFYEKDGIIYYNWAAAVGTASWNQTSEFSGKRQGICPEGWHIPTATEWSQLQTYVENIKGAGLAGKHLKNDSGWNYKEGIENLNCFGFNASADGFFGDTGFWCKGQYGYYWTASPNAANNATMYTMDYDGDALNHTTGTDDPKSFFRSIRCVKD